MSLFLIYLFAVVATFYGTRILLYEDTDTPLAGPFAQKSQTVVRVRAGTDNDDFSYFEHRQAVNLFDYFRRIFGLYDIVIPEDDPRARLWYIRENRLGVWTCPTCLSFWVSIPLLVLMSWGAGIAWYQFPVIIFATAGGSITLGALVNLLEEGMPSVTVQIPESMHVNDASQDGDYSSEQSG